MAARAAELADLLRELLWRRMARAFIRLPLVPPSVTLLTAAGPYAERIAEAEALMRDDPRIANASVAAGFVFSDLPKCGMTVTVTARGGDAARAQQAAAHLARQAWAARARHVPALTPLDQAVALAVAAGHGEAPPVLLADVADNPGGGGRGSTTFLLRALHEAGARGVVLGIFVDPDLAAEAHALGDRRRSSRRRSTAWPAGFLAGAAATCLACWRCATGRGGLLARHHGGAPLRPRPLGAAGTGGVRIARRRRFAAAATA